MYMDYLYYYRRRKCCKAKQNNAKMPQGERGTRQIRKRQTRKRKYVLGKSSWNHII
uniref:Uncharacterized protein n=1 Tax=Lepeophtheirus salmonis TaxID=72036 RepID=A0A0K2U6R3_LEPSM